MINCRNCEKLNKAMDVYKLFDWGEGFKAIGFDNKTDEILLSEMQIIRIIQMINPAQKVKKVRLVSQDELMEILLR